MKTRFLLPFAAAGVCGLIASAALAADGTPKDSKADAQQQPPTKAETPVPATVLPPSLREEKKREEATEKHIAEHDFLEVDTPPPPAKPETQYPSPDPSYKWKAGHWAPVNKQWTWVPGEWGPPPEPSSVWIESSYNEKTKKWSGPYWQADRPTPQYTEETPKKEELEPKKF